MWHAYTDLALDMARLLVCHSVTGSSVHVNSTILLAVKLYVIKNLHSYNNKLRGFKNSNK